MRLPCVTRARSIARSTRRSSWTAWGWARNSRAVERSKTRSKSRSRSARTGIARGTVPEPAGSAMRRDQRRTMRGTTVWAPAGPGLYTLGPVRRAPESCPVHRGHHDGDPHRVVLRTVRHPLHVRDGGPKAVAVRACPRGDQGPSQLRHAGREHVLRGDGRRPQRPGAERHRPPARRLPQDLQLLHDLPPVHVRQLLERRRRSLPHLLAPARGRTGGRRPRGGGCARGARGDGARGRGRRGRDVARGGSRARAARPCHGPGRIGCDGGSRGGGRSPRREPSSMLRRCEA